MLKCPLPYCFAPEISCNSGEDNYLECEHWRDAKAEVDEGATAEGADTSAVSAEITQLLPWSGNTMGSADLTLLSSRRRPKVVGIVGPQNAGKTTALALLYLLLRRGHCPQNCRFAGSYSLGGWEQLASFFELKTDSRPQFPPHTSATDARRPGMLHLAFRHEQDGKVDTLWTDAPGEWFRRWAVSRDDPAAAGAAWTHEHADAFLLFADSQALAGEANGMACMHLEWMAERMSEGIGDRPVGLVWAKTDIDVEASVRARVEGACRTHLPNLRIFSINVPQKETAKQPLTNLITEFLSMMDWLLRHNVHRIVSSDLPVLSPSDPLLAYRGE